MSNIWSFPWSFSQIRELFLDIYCPFHDWSNLKFAQQFSNSHLSHWSHIKSVPVEDSWHFIWATIETKSFKSKTFIFRRSNIILEAIFCSLFSCLTPFSVTYWRDLWSEKTQSQGLVGVVEQVIRRTSFKVYGCWDSCCIWWDDDSH